MTWAVFRPQVLQWVVCNVLLFSFVKITGLWCYHPKHSIISGHAFFSWHPILLTSHPLSDWCEFLLAIDGWQGAFLLLVSLRQPVIGQVGGSVNEPLVILEHWLLCMLWCFPQCPTCPTQHRFPIGIDAPPKVSHFCRPDFYSLKCVFPSLVLLLCLFGCCCLLSFSSGSSLWLVFGNS